MTRTKVQEMREIHEFNQRVELIGLRKIEIDDVEQHGNQLNSDVRRK